MRYNNVCPGCGHCEHCGRPYDNQPQYPGPDYPYPRPFFPYRSPPWSIPPTIGDPGGTVMPNTADAGPFTC